MNVFLVSMGCAKNTVDSERLLGRLGGAHRVVSAPEEADVGIINTCGFIQDAVEENIDAILDLERMKEEGTLSHIIVAGCLVNRYEAELRQELPSVDLFVRAEEWDQVAAYLDGLDGAAGVGAPSSDCGRRLLPAGTPWSRWLKVSEGCDSRCAYCAIPMIRGPLRSVPIERLTREALALCGAGAKELCLVGQDLTVYGRDLGASLTRLVEELDRALPAGTWLRLFYLHPARVTEPLIDFLMGKEKVLRYLDIPIQHVNPDILARMGRPVPDGHIQKVFRYIRERDPLFTLRTTIMTGFPGETEAQFEEVLDFLRTFEPDRVGVFPYSPEEGTAAASFPNAVAREVAEDHCARLMEVQAGVSQERGSLFLGRELDVLAEEVDEEAGEVWGRSYRDAPEVDGMVCVSCAGVRGVAPGDILRAHITDCGEHDLFGALVEGERR